MGKDRARFKILVSIYERLIVRNGVSRKKVNSLNREASYLEATLSKETSNNAAKVAGSFVEREFPDRNSGYPDQ